MSEALDRYNDLKSSLIMSDYFLEYAILIEILFSTQDMQKKILVQLSDIPGTSVPLLLYRHLFNGASELLLAEFLR